ncbi:MAG: hypothetical protein C0609_09670 [Deltaproteobacteria bacterium]|nr:MAG: hypothetical protein C0609_09670 [Deltaproteobacteria bacterium]
MKQAAKNFEMNDEKLGSAYLIMVLLPPPISLDLLCLILGRSPIEVLNSAETLVSKGLLKKCEEMGAGYYSLTDFSESKKYLSGLAEGELEGAVAKAIEGVEEFFQDDKKRFMHIAHIYETSGVPVKHLTELVKAGMYCHNLNITTYAESYYRMALEAMEARELAPYQQVAFIDAAIGICMCRDSSLPHATQRRFLQEALALDVAHEDPVREIWLHILIARSYLRTVYYSEAGKHLERAWQMLDETEVTDDVRLQLALVDSERLFWQGHIDEAIKRYESVLGNHEELIENVETLRSFVKLGWVYGVAGETARGLGLIRAVRKKAQEMGGKDLERYATLMLVVVLVDAGRVEEAERYLSEVFDLPENLIDTYILWPGNGKRAYFAVLKGDFEGAYGYFNEAWEASKILGSPHHRAADNLEVMLRLERKGIIHPEWNFDSDIERLLEWPDLYMQGVALRYRARKEMEKSGDAERGRADLKRSIELLTRAGARIELAHAQIQMARINMDEKDYKAGEELLKKAWETFSKVNANLFPQDLKPYLDRTSKHSLWVESLLSVGEALSETRTKDDLLGQIIKQAMRISGAERGAIFMGSGSCTALAASRNIVQQELCALPFRAHMEVVETVFETAAEITRQVESFDPEAPERVMDISWIGCFPVKLRGNVIGVIYLDRGPAALELPEDETALLRIITNQAAVALENVEVFEEINDLKSEMEAETQYFREVAEAAPLGQRMLGRSDSFKKMMNLISRVADSDTTVMITGETGVGKEMVAQAIHRNSGRANGPFIAVNVAALSPELIASELFGHERGAYTGASQMRKGRFELAGGGTLFLDDIDACSLDIQAKLLRVLETRTFERVGGTRTLETNFRLLAASNRDLEDLVGKGLFRSDFYYRLNVFPIRIPPLRERVEDISILAKYFMEMFCKKFGKPTLSMTRGDLDVLKSYHWSGNIRELRHVIERAVLLSRGGRLTIPPLETSPLGVGMDDARIIPLKDMEARYIVKALERTGGKVSGDGGAAELLGVKPSTLYSMMKRLGISRESFKIKKRT